ncbi:hypothetical protein SDC9_189881 [bioreactor metagenome]|uniref:Uncharacterized protein n=1 Tax=bioreactor metagenome TaxID=1076179 RepID=A0A645I1J4_9ZZZZ
MGKESRIDLAQQCLFLFNGFQGFIVIILYTQPYELAYDMILAVKILIDGPLAYSQVLCYIINSKSFYTVEVYIF